jgi:hypothetical protein
LVNEIRSARTDRLLELADRWLGPLAVAVIAIVIIRRTMLPGVAFWDTAEFQVLGPVMGTGHAPGYPTYAILGWLANIILAPFGDPAFRMNLFSGLSVALAAGLAVILVRRLTGSGVLAVAAGLGLATTPLAWRLGNHAEGHTLHLAFLALLFVLLVWWERERRAGGGNRFLVAAAITFGISAGNHSLTLLLAPAIGLYVLAVDPLIWKNPRLVLGCGLAVVGSMALVYLELPLRSGPFRAPLVYANPHTWDNFWYVVTAEQFQDAIGNPLEGRRIPEFLKLVAENFGPLSVLIPVGFLATLVRAWRYAVLSGVALAVTVVFSLAYNNADITRYYLGPVFIAWTWLAILGATAVDQALSLSGDRADAEPGPALRRRPSAVLGLIGGVLAAAILLLPTVAELGERSRKLDESNNRDAQAWLDRVFAVVEPNADLVSWWSYSTPLWYAVHVEGRRTDVRIIDDRTRLDENLGELDQVIERSFRDGRPVYLLRNGDAEIPEVQEEYELEVVHDNFYQRVWRVVGRLGAAG